MIGIVIVAHGGLAGEFLKAVEHVVGRQSGVVAVPIGPDDDRAAKQSEICAVADGVDWGDGVVVVADMFGGSPSNLSLRACCQRDRRIIYGANLPMLVKLAKSRHMTTADAVRAAMLAGRKYIDTIDLPISSVSPAAPAVMAPAGEDRPVAGPEVESPQATATDRAAPARNQRDVMAPATGENARAATATTNAAPTPAGPAPAARSRGKNRSARSASTQDATDGTPPAKGTKDGAASDGDAPARGVSARSGGVGAAAVIVEPAGTGGSTATPAATPTAATPRSARG